MLILIYQNFLISLVLTVGLAYSKRLAYFIEYILTKNMEALWPSPTSSPFQKTICKFIINIDYLMARDVIHHSDIACVFCEERRLLKLFRLQFDENKFEKRIVKYISESSMK